MRPSTRHILAIALLALSALLQAQTPTQPSAAPLSGVDALLKSARTSGDDFLPPEQAFRFDALPDGTDRVRLNWEIADGYYLYHARIKVVTSSTSAQLGAPQFPPGQVKTDEYFGKQEVYHHELVVSVPVARAKGGALDLPLEVTYQGCADAGLCYPPQTKTLTVHLPDGTAASGSGRGGLSAAGGGGTAQAAASSIAPRAAFLSQEWFS